MSQVVTILFILHILLSFVYALDFHYARNNLQNSLLRFVVCMFIPVFGFAFMLFSDYMEHRMEQNSGGDLLRLMEKTTELELLTPLDLEEEVNKVPMVDALKMKEYAVRRKAVVDTMRNENVLDYIDVLKEALLNDDTETSHYASSVIMDVQGKLQNSLFQRELKFQENPEDKDNADSYEEELYKVIKSGIYEKRDLHKYFAKYQLLSEELLRREVVKECHIHHRLEIDFTIGDLVHAAGLCRRYKEEFPASEDMVVDHIRLYILTKDREALDRFISKLKTMPVHLTTYSLQHIRFFERAGK